MSSDESVGEFLANLEKERREHESSIEEHLQAITQLDALIPGIRARLGKPGQKTLNVQTQPNGSQSAGGPFAGLSVRKAILKFLLHQDLRIKTAEIAPALKKGGVVSDALDFPSAVSATLSVMRSKRNEVIGSDEGWELTDAGRKLARQLTGYTVL